MDDLGASAPFELDSEQPDEAPEQLDGIAGGAAAAPSQDSPTQPPAKTDRGLLFAADLLSGSHPIPSPPATVPNSSPPTRLSPGLSPEDIRAELSKAKEVSMRLSQKIKEQARELQNQSGELEKAHAYCNLCEQRIREIAPDHPLPVNAETPVKGTHNAQPPLKGTPSLLISESAQHRRQMRELQAKLATLEREFSAAQCEKLQVHVRELESSNRSTQDYMSKIETKLSTTDKKEIEDLTAEKQRLLEGLHHETLQAEEQRAYIEVLKNALDNKALEMGLAPDQGHLLFELQDLRQQSERAEKVQAEKDEQIGHLDEELRAVRGQLEATQTAQAAAAKEADERRAQADQLTTDKTSLQERLETLEHEKQELLNYAEKQIAYGDELQATLKQTQQHYTTAQEEKASLQAALDEARKRLQDLDEHATSVSKNLDSVDASRTQLAQDIVALRQQNSSLEERLKKRSEELADATSLQSELLSAIRDAKKEKDDMQSGYDRATAESAEARKKAADVQEMVTVLKAELEKARRQHQAEKEQLVHEAEAKAQSFQEQIGDSNAVILELHTVVEETKAQVAAAEQKLKQQQDEEASSSQQYERSLGKLKEDLQQAQAALAESGALIGTHEHDLAECRDQTKSLQQRLAETGARLAETEKTLETMRQEKKVERKMLHEEIHILQQENHDLTERLEAESKARQPASPPARQPPLPSTGLRNAALIKPIPVFPPGGRRDAAADRTVQVATVQAEAATQSKLLRDQLAQAQAQVEQAMSQASARQEQAAQAQLEAGRLSQQAQRLEEQHAAQRAAAEKATAELASTRAALERAQAEGADVRAQLTAAQSALQQAQLAAAEKERAMASLGDQLAAATRNGALEHTVLLEKIHALENALAEQREQDANQIAEATSQASEMQTALDEARHEYEKNVLEREGQLQHVQKMLQQTQARTLCPHMPPYAPLRPRRPLFPSCFHPPQFPFFIEAERDRLQSQVTSVFEQSKQAAAQAQASLAQRGQEAEAVAKEAEQHLLKLREADRLHEQDAQRIAELQQQLETIKNERAVERNMLHDQSYHVRAEKEGLAKELQDRDAKIAELQAALEALQATNAQNESALQQFTAQAGDIQKEMEQLTALKDELTSLYDSVQQEKGVNTAEVEELRNQRIDLEGELNQTREELHRLQAESATEQALLKTKLDAFGAEAAAAKQQLQQASGQYKERAQQLQEMQTAYRKLRAEHANLAEQRLNMERDLAAAMQELEQTRGNLSVSEGARELLKKEYDEMGAKGEEERAATEAEMRELRAKMHAATEEQHTLAKQVHEYKALYEQALARAKQLTTENLQLKFTVDAPVPGIPRRAEDGSVAPSPTSPSRGSLARGDLATPGTPILLSPPAPTFPQGLHVSPALGSLLARSPLTAHLAMPSKGSLTSPLVAPGQRRPVSATLHSASLFSGSPAPAAADAAAPAEAASPAATATAAPAAPSPAAEQPPSPTSPAAPAAALEGQGEAAPKPTRTASEVDQAASDSAETVLAKSSLDGVSGSKDSIENKLRRVQQAFSIIREKYT
ncbi:hypothetical protein PAPYR_10645 [Paratrimastix pyriformis]|uniref:Nucleoprotein TPR n=1 Tax=Paratrimastix pyriformis TaxID=342808 RepID=A0ABQ8U850_9EUKA|nr:hypothetical protein PAPYR_10645 [Paratrimastix pyriformis]